MTKQQVTALQCMHSPRNNKNKKTRHALSQRPRTTAAPPTDDDTPAWTVWRHPHPLPPHLPAARGSQSATDPMMVAAEVAEKKPRSSDRVAAVIRRTGDLKETYKGGTGEVNNRERAWASTGLHKNTRGGCAG